MIAGIFRKKLTDVYRIKLYLQFAYSGLFFYFGFVGFDTIGIDKPFGRLRASSTNNFDAPKPMPEPVEGGGELAKASNMKT